MLDSSNSASAASSARIQKALQYDAMFGEGTEFYRNTNLRTLLKTRPVHVSCLKEIERRVQFFVVYSFLLAMHCTFSVYQLAPKKLQESSASQIDDISPSYSLFATQSSSSPVSYSLGSWQDWDEYDYRSSFRDVKSFDNVAPSSGKKQHGKIDFDELQRKLETERVSRANEKKGRKCPKIKRTDANDLEELLLLNRRISSLPRRI